MLLVWFVPTRKKRHGDLVGATQHNTTQRELIIEKPLSVFFSI